MNKHVFIHHAKRLYYRLRLQRVVCWYNNTRYLYRKPFIKILSTVAVGDQGIYIRGWVLGPPEKRIKRVEFCRQGHPPIDITDKLVWISDENLSRQFGQYKYRMQPRFIAYIKVPIEDCIAVRLDFILESGRYMSRLLKPETVKVAPLKAVECILRSIPPRSPNKRMWFDKVYGPALRDIWASRVQHECTSDVVHYNQALSQTQPVVSVVIPIYGRYDFMEYQLSEFVNDQDMFNHEIIYVIDDPRLTEEVRLSAAVLAKIYKIPFTVVFLSQNLGYAGANNQAARVATAVNLLLMNSDVMPAKAGWLSELVQAAGENIGSRLTGVRLLYEDNSIQHNGMSFFASPFVDELWTNIHPAKGFPSDMLAATDAQVSCDAVTGACILLTRENFLALDGFDEDYILGDYEDSDLCMRARTMGLRIFINERVVLYHLERLSQSLVSQHVWKDQLTYYNCWLHTQKWDKDICTLKRENTRESVIVAESADGSTDGFEREAAHG